MLSVRLQNTPCTSGGRSRPNRCLRPQQRDAEQAVLEDVLADQTGVGKARQQQRVGPDQNADDHAGDRAARGAARQIRPPKNAGANCAMAANDSRPIDASCASPAKR